MASIKCRHCGAKFSFRTDSGRISDRHTMLNKYNISAIGHYYYCDGCVEWISKWISKHKKKEELKLPKPPPPKRLIKEKLFAPKDELNSKPPKGKE